MQLFVSRNCECCLRHLHLYISERSFVVVHQPMLSTDHNTVAHFCFDFKMTFFWLLVLVRPSCPCPALLHSCHNVPCVFTLLSVAFQCMSWWLRLYSLHTVPHALSLKYVEESISASYIAQMANRLLTTQIDHALGSSYVNYDQNFCDGKYQLLLFVCTSSVLSIN